MKRSVIVFAVGAVLALMIAAAATAQKPRVRERSLMWWERRMN